MLRNFLQRRADAESTGVEGIFWADASERRSSSWGLGAAAECGRSHTAAGQTNAACNVNGGAGCAGRV